MALHSAIILLPVFTVFDKIKYFQPFADYFHIQKQFRQNLDDYPLNTALSHCDIYYV